MSFFALSLGCPAVFAILCVVQNDVTGNNSVEIVSVAVRIEKNRLRQKRITGRKLKRNQTYTIHWQMRDLSMKILVLQMCQGR